MRVFWSLDKKWMEEYGEQNVIGDFLTKMSALKAHFEILSKQGKDK